MKNKTNNYNPLGLKEWDRKDPRYNEVGLIDIEGYLKILKNQVTGKRGIDIRKDSFLLCINGIRNMGKSTWLWDFMWRTWQETDFKTCFGFIRLKDIQVKNIVKEFNNYFADRNLVCMYPIMYKIDYNDKGKIVNKRKIGTFASMSTEHNFKSMNFRDYHYWIFDEYNSVLEVPNVYFKFTNLLKTIKRFTEPFGIIMIGNKDNANDEFMVSWGIDDIDYTSKKDYVNNFMPGKNFYFIDIANETFKHVNIDDLVADFASFNETTNRYINEGGYIQGFHKNVINYDKRVKNYVSKRFCILRAFESYFEIGLFRDNDLYIRNLDDKTALECGLPIILPSVLEVFDSGLAKGVTDEWEVIDLVELIYEKSTRNKLYYTSFNFKSELEYYFAAVYKRNVLKK